MDVLLELGRRAKPDALPSVAKHLMMFESQIKDLVLSQGGMITSQTSRDLRPLQPPTTPGTLLCINPPLPPCGKGNVLPHFEGQSEPQSPRPGPGPGPPPLSLLLLSGDPPQELQLP